MFEVRASIMQVGLRPPLEPPNPKVCVITAAQALREMSAEMVLAKHDFPSCFVKVTQPPPRKPLDSELWAVASELPFMEDKAEIKESCDV